MIVMRACLLLIVFLLQAAAASAQPLSTAVFTASTDHAVVSNGVALVDSYQLDIMVGSATGALAISIPLGKPVPDASQTITVNILSSLVKLASGTYVATVSAVGPGGAGRSAPSDPFVQLGSPAPPGKPSIR